MAGEEFDSEMRDVAWAEVYERQAARGDPTEPIVELLDMEPSDDLLALGCGPGYTVIQLARRASTGTIYALDRRRGALRHLRSRARSAFQHVELLVGDVAELPVRPSTPLRTLAAIVLHHVDRPARAVASIGQALPTGSPLLVLEYDPEGPGEYGPPPAHRLPVAACWEWLEGAGFAEERTVELPEEKYGLLARRT